MKGLQQSLDNVDASYRELIKIADDIVKPFTGDLDKIIGNTTKNIERLTIDDLRQLMLELSLKAYSLGEVKEKSALKLTCAETLKDEMYAKKFNEADGTVKDRETSALLESSYEILSQAIYNEAYSMLKLKLDEVHRIVDSIKSVIMSRMQEAKLSSINSTIE